MDVAGYVAQIKKYLAYEVANIKKAQAAGLGAEHLKLIMDRIDTVKAEIAEMEQGLAGQEAEAEAATAAAQAEAAAKAAQAKARAEAKAAKATPAADQPKAKANYD